MEKTPDELLAIKVGGKTVAENLRKAIEAGRVIENGDGGFRLAQNDTGDSNWVAVANAPPLGCRFLMGFLFEHAYDHGAVPFGCRNCYKVKVMPQTLRELVAAWEIGKRLEFRSKWGIDFNNSYSQNIYAGYIYLPSLDIARAVYKVVRAAADQDPKLGSVVPMVIKRGCSEYEVQHGPSDRYQFAPELEELENYLSEKFKRTDTEGPRMLPLARWIDFAYRIGDDTYLDFTGGERLYTKSVSYDP